MNRRGMDRREFNTIRPWPLWVKVMWLAYVLAMFWVGVYLGKLIGGAL